MEKIDTDADTLDEVLERLIAADIRTVFQLNIDDSIEDSERTLQLLEQLKRSDFSIHKLTLSAKCSPKMLQALLQLDIFDFYSTNQLNDQLFEKLDPSLIDPMSLKITGPISQQTIDKLQEFFLVVEPLDLSDRK